MSTLSPAMSACSSIQGEIKTCWGTDITPYAADLYQSSSDGAYLEVPTQDMAPFPVFQLGPDLADMGRFSGHMGEGNSPPSTSSSISESSFSTFGHVSTIATRNERRKTQNRAAQRAYRTRQQQALVEANLKMRSLQEELDEAVDKKDHFEQLFKSLRSEHGRLLEKFHEMLALVQPQSLAS